MEPSRDLAAEYSAKSAAYASHFGLPLAFADFISQSDGPAIADHYRANYQPSERHPEPEILVALEKNPALTNYAKRRIWEYREHLLPKEKVPPGLAWTVRPAWCHSPSARGTRSLVM